MNYMYMNVRAMFRPTVGDGKCSDATTASVQPATSISTCGNIVMCDGKFVDIVMPYQRFVSYHRTPRVDVIDVNASLRGPMLTSINGPFSYSREATTLCRDTAVKRRGSTWCAHKYQFQ